MHRFRVRFIPRTKPFRCVLLALELRLATLICCNSVLGGRLELEHAPNNFGMQAHMCMHTHVHSCVRTHTCTTSYAQSPIAGGCWRWCSLLCWPPACGSGSLMPRPASTIQSLTRKLLTLMTTWGGLTMGTSRYVLAEERPCIQGPAGRREGDGESPLWVHGSMADQHQRVLPCWLALRLLHATISPCPAQSIVNACCTACASCLHHRMKARLCSGTHTNARTHCPPLYKRMRRRPPLALCMNDCGVLVKISTALMVSYSSPPCPMP